MGTCNHGSKIVKGNNQSTHRHIRYLVKVLKINIIADEFFQHHPPQKKNKKLISILILWTKIFFQEFKYIESFLLFIWYSPCLEQYLFYQAQQ